MRTSTTKEYKYNRERLIQSCVSGDIDGFDLYYPKVLISISTYITLALRHGNIELAEYILVKHPKYTTYNITNSVSIERTKSHIWVKIVKSINNKKETPELFKMRKSLLYSAVNNLWRKRKLSEVITCLNYLPTKERYKHIDVLLIPSSNSSSELEMRSGLIAFLREETINKILK